MSSFIKSITHEWLLLRRSGVAGMLILVTWGCMLPALLLSWMTYERGHAERQAAEQLFTRQWCEQQTNPHNAAHFGTWLFTPLTLKGMLDPGLNDFCGTTYRVEAHVQHEMDYSPAESGNVVGRLGQFSIVMVLQLVVPFLLLLTASRSMTSERELGTLPVLRVQARSITAIVWSKVWAYYLLFAGILLPFLLLFSFAIWWVVAYLLFYFLLTLIAMLISRLAGSSMAASISAIVTWLLLFVVIPRMAVNQAVVSHPILSRAVFENRVREGYLKGLDGKTSYYERGERFSKLLLQRYGVDSVAALPFNIAGVMLQYHEAYQEMTFLRNYREVTAGFDKQQHFLSVAGWLDPYIALKRVSMSLSGTGFYHHDDFYRQARFYRSRLMRRLNLELAAHTGSYRADSTFYHGLDPFRYRESPGNSVPWSCFAAICAWILVAVCGVQISSKSLSGY